MAGAEGSSAAGGGVRRYFDRLQGTDRIGCLFGGLIVLVVLVVILFSRGAKPSIVGTWQTDWTGDNYGVETINFNRDGRYELKSSSGIMSKKFAMRKQEFGTYTYVGGRLSLRRLESVIEYLDSSGNVKKRVKLSASLESTWSNISLDAGGFVLGSPEGAPPTGDPPQRYKRKVDDLGPTHTL